MAAAVSRRTCSARAVACCWVIVGLNTGLPPEHPDTISPARTAAATVLRRRAGQDDALPIRFLIPAPGSQDPGPNDGTRIGHRTRGRGRRQLLQHHAAVLAVH